MGLFSNKETKEEIEPDPECTFQFNWDSDDESFECGLNEHTYCEKSKCPFWREK